MQAMLRHRPSTVRPGNARPPAALRFAGPPKAPPALHALARSPELARLEAALFLADEPVSAKKLAGACDLKNAEAALAGIAALRELLAKDDSGLEIIDVAGGFRLVTAAVAHTWLLRLRRTGHDLRLTPMLLETLAIIAYRQPIMRAEVESIRGVACADAVKSLMEKGMVRVVGRHDSLGRPQLYGTAPKFLQLFGLNSLADLPEVSALPRPSEHA
jgi:segregation and condensation protein B